MVKLFSHFMSEYIQNNQYFETFYQKNSVDVTAVSVNNLIDLQI
jgi:hypothetical protein